MWTGSGAMCSSTADATPASWARQRSTRSSATFELVDRHASWSWTATHISALRTVFDKLGGMTLTAAMPTPKRPRRLHDVLSPDEVAHLLRAAGSTRDRLAILLLYGCGLKTSEACGLRWEDVDIAWRRPRTTAGTCRRRRRVRA